ncbi:MAG: hypothetical protein M1829_001860 [Trizodia sp. TS-e1964]|nr:MAG: hypothetical protein M1829_001860 [Trizodia sp. TS-e1964]
MHASILLLALLAAAATARPSPADQSSGSGGEGEGTSTAGPQILTGDDIGFAELAVQCRGHLHYYESGTAGARGCLDKAGDLLDFPAARHASTPAHAPAEVPAKKGAQCADVLVGTANGGLYVASVEEFARSQDAEDIAFCYLEQTAGRSVFVCQPGNSKQASGLADWCAFFCEQKLVEKEVAGNGKKHVLTSQATGLAPFGWMRQDGRSRLYADRKRMGRIVCKKVVEQVAGKSA